MGLRTLVAGLIGKRSGSFASFGSFGSPGSFGTLDAASPLRGWPVDRSPFGPGTVAPLNLFVVRWRSVSATLNNPYMARAAEVWPSALIGAGIVTASGNPDPSVRRDLQLQFKAWGLRCDAEGRLDWPGIQAAAVREMVVQGESFIHLRYTPDGLRLQLIPADFVDPGLNRELPGGGFIHAGIEFDASGARVAYHVFPRRPEGFASFAAPVRIPAADILHLFRPLAPGQVRGIPWAAPILLTLSELDGLLDALLVAARVSALHAGFITDVSGTGGVPYEGVQLGSVLESGLEPGTLKILPNGMDVKFSSPQAANQAIELAKLNLRSIAMGLGLPDHVLSGDLSGANYSSLRAGLVEWRQRIEQIQYQVIIPQLIRPVWERWIEHGNLTGELNSPDVASAVTAEFYPPAQPWVDPLKDAEAEAALIAAGLKSRRQAVAQQGYDVEALDAEIAADHAREAALGLSFGTAAPSPNTGTPGTP